VFVTLLCAAVFCGIGVWAYRSTSPVHFWSRTTVAPAQIKDIKAYNQANGLMWLIYSALWAVSAVLGFINSMVAAGAMVLLCFPGLMILIICYRRIFAKFKVQ
ncbi:MAG: hypothetical protein PHG02_08295, partial [Oscillospiraceae bacterium]|nr:hypothetical protein [Oscillospiraceae bacterium]